MKIYILIITLFMVGCAQKSNIDRSRSYFSKEDDRVNRKRMLKNIDKEIKSIVNLDNDMRETAEDKSLGESELNEIEAAVRRELGYE